MEDTRTIYHLIDELDLKWEYVFIWEVPREDNKPKKVVKGVGQNITDITALVKKYDWLAPKDCTKYTAYHIKLKDEPLVVVDLDEDVDLETIFTAFPWLRDTYYIKGNSVGYHFYIYNEMFDGINFNKMDCMTHFKGDLLGEKVFEKTTKELYNDGLHEIDNEDVVSMFPDYPFTTQQPAKTDTSSNQQPSSPENFTAVFDGNYDELEEIVDNIPKKFSDNYGDWIKIISVLKKYNMKDLAEEFSKKSVKYNKVDFEDHYFNKSMKTDQLSIGSVYHYSKQNKTGYEKITNKYKKKELETMSEYNYEKVKDEFEHHHFKVVSKNVFCKYNEEEGIVEQYRPAEFREMYNHMVYEGVDKSGTVIDKCFIEKYMKANRTMRIYQNMDYYPNPELCPSTHFNLWTPFDVEKLVEFEECQGSLDVILNHINILCNRDKVCYEFFLDWLAHMFVRPWEKSGVLILFVSKEGCGKGSLLTLLKLMIGQRRVFECAQPGRDLLGNFNSLLAETYLVNLEELQASDVSFSTNGVFKSLITDVRQTLRKLHKDAVGFSSYHRFIGSTNNINCPVVTKPGDRRQMIIPCSNELIGNKKYFTKFRNTIHSKNAQAAFLNYLKQRPDADVFMSKYEKLPITQFQQELQEKYEDIVTIFFKGFVATYHKPNEKYQFTNRELFIQFNEFIEEGKYKYNLNQDEFKGRMINITHELEHITYKKSNTMKFTLDWSPLCKELGVCNPNVIVVESSEEDDDEPVVELIEDDPTDDERYSNYNYDYNPSDSDSD